MSCISRRLLACALIAAACPLVALAQVPPGYPATYRATTLLKDYSLVFSRVAFVSKQAKNPNAARLFLDYLLSKRGRTTLSTASELYSIRSDVDGETTMAGLTKEYGASLKPIPIDAALLTYFDQTRRLEFLKQWHQVIKI